MTEYPRQVLVILYHHGQDPGFARLTPLLGQSAVASLLMSCLLDLLGQVLRLSGVNVVVVASQTASVGLRAVLPAGVTVLPVPGTVPAAGIAAFAIGALREHGYVRLVTVRADALAVPAIDIGTACGALATADVIVGPTPAGASYLTGVTATAIDAMGATLWLDAARVLAGVQERGLVGRRVAARPILAEITTYDQLAGLADLAGLGHRVSSWVEEQTRPG